MNWQAKADGRDDTAPRGSHPSAHPLACPITSTGMPPLTSQNGPPGSLNDAAVRRSAPSPRIKRALGPRDVADLADWLSDRDLAVLRSVAEHQFLTVAQIEVLHFHDHAPASGARIARRTLARLRRHRLLGTLERRIGGVRAGSTGLVHYLDSVGDQLLSGRTGRQARRRSLEPSSRFLAHRLAVADTHVALVAADRAGTIELVECTVEPSSWRRSTGLGGARLILKTDLYAETGAGNDFVRSWFVEVDLGTESIPTLVKKSREYETYRRSGVEQETSGSFPVVIWSVTHRDSGKAHARRHALREALAADTTLPPNLFQVIAPGHLIETLQTGGQP